MARAEAIGQGIHLNSAGPSVGIDSRPKLVAQVLQRGFTHKLFPDHQQLIPQMHELYEMELASAEAALMSDGELVRNAGYFARVGNERRA
jgi:hypothetical protein